MSKISVSHCVVPGCAGRRGHTFPLQDPIRMNNWLEAVKWKHHPMPHKSAFVCYNHFKKTDYRQREDRKIIPGVKTRMRLKKKAVPSVFEPYHGSDSPKDANVLLPPLLIEVGDRENSSLHDEGYTIGDLKFDLEDGVSESDVNASIFNALNCSSSVEDVDISSFAESVRSKLFADHEETQSILLHSTEGMLEITTKLPTTHPLDYDSDTGEGGFITISRNFEGLSDGSDSDIIIPLKNESVRFEPFEESSVRSEPTIVPTVTNIIVFDANEEGMSTMKSLLLAQIKADENGRPNPKHIDSKHVSVEYDSQDDVKLIQHQTDYRYITEKIKHLNLTHQAPKISEYTKPSNTNNLLKKIKKTLPKVVVNMRKVMVIRNSNKCPKFSSPPASILRNYQSGVFRKTESSPALNSKLPTINFGVKTLYDRRMQLCSKGFQNVKIGKQPKFIIISEKSKESNSKVRDEECDESPEVKLPDATTISGTLSYGNSEPQCKDVKSNDVLLYDGDSDSSLDLHISLSSDSESPVMEDRGNENELISNDSPDFMRKNRATGVLTFDLDCEDEVAGKSHDESTRSARMDNEEPGFETTTGDFEVGANENENSSKKSGLPTNSEVGMLKPSERVDDAAACNSDSPTNSANNSSEHSKEPEEIMSISNNKNESIEFDEAEGQKTADFSNSVVVGRTVNLLNESELNNGDFADKVDASAPPHQVMDLKETATDHDAGKSGGIDVQADTVLEDDSLETKDYSAGSENQGATDGEGRWECLSITNSDLSDSEYYDGLVQEHCLQFEVVDNDSEMVLEEINCSLEPFIVLENDLEMVQEDVHDTTDHPKLYQDHPVIDAISEEMYDETGDTSPPSQFDVCEANSKPMAPTQGSSIRLIVPEHMLLPLGGPSTTKRKPPPLILPDHDYTYGTTNFKRKRRKKMENRETFQLKQCSVVLKRLSPSTLEMYCSDSESVEEIEGPANIPCETSPAAIENNVCFHCNVVRSSKELLCNHISLNHTANMFVCPHCDGRFDSVIDCNNHVGICDFIVESVSSHITYLCPQCDFSTKDDSALRGHIDIEHKVQCNYSCPTCPFKCVSAQALQNHMKRYHASTKASSLSSESIPAAETSSISRTTFLLDNTKTELTNLTNLNCPHCEIKFSTPFSLLHHVRRFHDVSSCNSSVQPAASTQSTPVISTSQILQSANSFESTKCEEISCGYCPCKFLSRSLLEEHETLCHRDKQPVHQNHCKLCSFTTKYPVGMAWHVRTCHSNTSVAQPIVEANVSTNLIRKPVRLVQKTPTVLNKVRCIAPKNVQNDVNLSLAKSNFMAPINSLSTPIGSWVIQPGCTVRHPQIQTEQGKPRIKCLFPKATPKDQFVRIALPHSAPPPPKPENLPEVKVDLTDDSEYGIVCPQCNETKESYADLGRHIVECHSKNKKHFKCPCCPRVCSTKLDLKRHIRLGHGFVTCPKCYLTIKRSAIQNHMVSKHRSASFVCDECDFITTVDSVMQLHRMVIHKVNSSESNVLTCPVCPLRSAKFSTIKCLKDHALQRHFYLYRSTTEYRTTK